MDVLTYGITLLVIVVSAACQPALWRNRTRAWDEPPPTWFWSESLFPAFRRAWGLLTVTLFVTWVTAVMPDSAPTGGGALAVVSYALAALWIVLALLNVTVIFYNRPKLLVPPHLRGEPGLVELHKRARRAGVRPRR